ncbi:hypothetical protein Poli38472_010527 [Pythium oligandrum]|uniref:Peptidase S1 domain-containing protein n=1 Tax=Pythium oligandrum TaxID=41045 RepID=A0A8K1C385_PYTOL|nr:hypothetical protein Poli38472_010527 [Pythium oligandrum]|eukprot:TMW55645.1 hypothetical protein Poli38472_010527 [Pythium oligandrum]
MKFALIATAGALAVASVSASGPLSYPEFLVKTSMAAAIAKSAQEEGTIFKPLILGGTEVPAGEKLWTVGLRSSETSSNYCGGTLITPKHVLTAAHCFGAITHASIGSRFLNGSKDGERIKVSKQTSHPDYNTSTSSNDFMILELATASKVTPVKLKTTEPAVDTTATVNGWGFTSQGGSQPTIQLQVDVPIVSDASCAATLDITPATMICAGGKANQDSCQCDSGGPLTIKSGSDNIQVGVVSWGIGCGLDGYPGVYASVPSAKSWIDATLKGTGYNATWVA